MSSALHNRTHFLRSWSVLLALALLFQTAASAQTPAQGSSGSEAYSQEALRKAMPGSAGEQVDFLGLMAGPVDENTYVVGPGDRFLLGIWSQPPVELSVRVDLEGNLPIPGSGVYPIAGMTLAEARESVFQGLRRFHPGASLTLSLVEARRFRVFLVGNVVEPGSYAASGADRVSDLLDRGGDLPASASQRRIVLVRRDGDSLQVDLEGFRRTGDFDLNPLLQDGDRVVVPFQGIMVEIYGPVGRDGSFEYVDGERFSDLLALAGGLTPAASADSVQMVQVTPRGQENPSRFFSFPAEDPLLCPRCQFFVRTDPFYERGPLVTLAGEFLYPNIMPIEEGVARVRDAIMAAGGFTEEAAIGEAVLLRSGAVEELTDLEFERLKQVPVADMNETEYEYYKMKLRERPGKMQVDFQAVREEPDHPDNILLLRGDIITVPSLREYIQVSGQVAEPGAVRFEVTLTIGDYIERAGGFAWNARKSHLTWIRAQSGEWVRDPDQDSHPAPGDVIWVPEKPDRDYWILFRDTMTVAAQMATIVLLAREVTR